MPSKGLGLHNDLQNEHSIVGNLPLVTMLDRYGTDDQKAMIDGSITGKYRITFGLTEPDHGSDATHMETKAVPATRDNVKGWLINGQKMWTTGMHVATHCALFARTSGNDGDARGITCLLVPAKSEGVKVEEYMWTFNMPTDHPRVSFTDVFVPEDALFGEVGRGLSLAQCFVHENRIRQAASSLGAAVYCINESVKYARERKPFGKALAENQAIQWPLVELATQAEMLRLLIRKTAWEMDQLTQAQVEHTLSDRVSMCNFWANRLCCEAADRAMQVHGGMGYSRHKPFEHIYRHHRRYRITEGSEEIQKRKVAGFLFGYMGAGKQALGSEQMEGGCTCRHIRYRLTGKPMIVHACHCTWCQRETGSVHALNAMYEADGSSISRPSPKSSITPSESGKGQRIARCPICKVAIWSNYPQAGPAVRFVRVGTMDDPTLCPPDVHIFTSTKQPWVTLPPDAKVFAEFYDIDEVWSDEAKERRRSCASGRRSKHGVTAVIASEAKQSIIRSRRHVARTRWLLAMTA